MSASAPLVDTIEPDEIPQQFAPVQSQSSSSPRTQVPVKPTTQNAANNASGIEAGISGIFRQSAHPTALFFLLFFRTAALAVYVLGGFVTNNYVLSTVLVVVLLAMDFWNCRNVAGRKLVGLRFWNQVDEDGESYWVFESRDPSRPPNPTDSRVFWTTLYVFPALWSILLFVSLIKLNFAFIPIVILAMVFNITSVVGFTYADRDAKQRWSMNDVSHGWNTGVNWIGSQVLSGVVKQSVGRVGRVFG